MELLLILVVLVGGFGLLAGRLHWLEHRDASLTEAAGDGWRIRSELPHDAGSPYSDFATDLFLLMPSDVMEGTEEGFEVAYFTIEDGGGWRSRIQRPAATVQVAVETPKFRYLAEGCRLRRGPRPLDARAADTAPSRQRHTGSHRPEDRRGVVARAIGAHRDGALRGLRPFQGCHDRRGKATYDGAGERPRGRRQGS